MTLAILTMCAIAGASIYRGIVRPILAAFGIV
jgi:hypothetical protein